MTQVAQEISRVGNLTSFMLKFCLDMKNHSTTPMSPFSLFLDSVGAQSLHVLEEDESHSTEDLFSMAIRKSRPQTAVFAMESTLSVDGQTLPAILLKVYEKGKAEMTIYAQAYRQNAAQGSFVKVGNLKLMGTIPNQLDSFRLLSFSSLFSFLF